MVTHNFPGYHWIYWLGPFLGSLVAAAFFYLLEAFDWTTANPGQDFDDLEVQMMTPTKKTSRPNIALAQAPSNVGADYNSTSMSSEKHVLADGGVAANHDSRPSPPISPGAIEAQTV